MRNLVNVGAVLKGSVLAGQIIAKVGADVRLLRAQGVVPTLASVSIGDAPPTEVYVRNQRLKALQAGIEFSDFHLPPDLSEEAALNAISRLNGNENITGIIIQRPIPRHISIMALQSAVDQLKDVEGMNPTSIGNIVYNELDLGPCTALAAVALLKSTGLTLQGLEVTIIGHSEIVGKPIAFLLMAEGATVTVCHHMTRSVAVHSRRADALLVAVGKPQLIKAEMVKPGAAVIDVGINSVLQDDGSQTVVGDVDFEEVRNVASWVTPVPGGVGPVTVAMLLRNTAIAAKLQMAAGWHTAALRASAADIGLDNILY